MTAAALILAYLAVGLVGGAMHIRRYPTWDPITDGLVLFCAATMWPMFAIAGVVILPFVALASLINRKH